MVFDFSHINILLSFVRSLSKSSDPDKLLTLNKRSSLLLDSLFKQIRSRIEPRQILLIDSRLENIVLALAYLCVELDPKSKTRTSIINVLLEFYPKIVLAKYYETNASNYKHALPPAEVFSFHLHTAFTEIASTSHNEKTRDAIMSYIAETIRKFIERIRTAAHEKAKDRYQSIYQFEMPVLLGALRAIGRISVSNDSIISQLFPASFHTPTQSSSIQHKDLNDKKVSFHPILSKALSKNIIETNNDIVSQYFPDLDNEQSSSDDLEDTPVNIEITPPIENLDIDDTEHDPFVHHTYLNVCGSTYNHERTTYSYTHPISDRFQNCVNVYLLEYMHESLKLIDQSVLKYLDNVASSEFNLYNRTNELNKNFKHRFMYKYFTDIFILCILKFFRDNLQLISKSTERLLSIKKSIYSFVQQLILVKVLDLDDDEYNRNIYRYKIRVESNAAAFELLCLSCYDDIEAEKLCAKCAEKFRQETLPTKLLIAQAPLLVISLQVLSQLAEKYKALAVYTIRALFDFLTEPSPILFKLYRQTGLKLDMEEHEQLKNRDMQASGAHRGFRIFKKLRDTAIEGLCKSLLIHFHFDSKCVEALLMQLSGRLASGHVKDSANSMFNVLLLDAAPFKRRASMTENIDKEAYESLLQKLLVSHNTILTLGHMAIFLKDVQHTQQAILARFQQRLGDPPSPLDLLIINQIACVLMFKLPSSIYKEIIRLFTEIIIDSVYQPYDNSTKEKYLPRYHQAASGVINALGNVAAYLASAEELIKFLGSILELFVQLGLKSKIVIDKTNKNALKSSNTSGSLGVLLPIIALIMDRLGIITEPSERLFRLFQRFWFYCVLYGYVDAEKSWAAEWQKYIYIIAVKSPTLVNENVYYVPLKAAMPLKREQITKEDNHELKSKLSAIFSSFPNAKHFIDRFGFEQSAYTLSVYFLETYRVRHSLMLSSFQSIFFYLEDPGIIKDRYGLWALMIAIGRKSFEIYVEEMKKMAKSPERNKNLEVQCQFLMAKRVHVRAEVREEARLYLHKLLSKTGFPHLFCSPVIIETLMNIINILSFSLDEDNEHKVITRNPIPNTNHTIQFVDTHEKRLDLFNTFVDFGRMFIDQALSISPTLVKSCIHDFMLRIGQRQRNSNITRQHRGLHVMWEYLSLGSSESDGNNTQNGTKLFYRKDFAEYMISLSERTAAIGFVEGLNHIDYRTAFDQVKKEMEFAIRNRVTSIEKFKSSQQRRRRMSIVAPVDNKGITMDFEERITIFDNQFRNALFKLTAMLIHNINKNDDNDNELNFVTTIHMSSQSNKRKENILDREMVHALIWLPIKMFTTSVMEAAVDCWAWAIIGRPELELLIVSEIYKGWEKTISDRIGLYSLDIPEPSPFAPSEREELKPKSPSINPHRIFFKFIEERVQLSIHKTDIEMEMIVVLFHKSLSLIGENRRTSMTKHISAVGLRFRLLYLALYLVQSDYLSDEINKYLLREKIYHTAFDYFTIQHHCPTQTHTELSNDIRILYRFFALVHGEKKFCNDSTSIIENDSLLANGYYNNDATEKSSKVTAPSGFINSLASGGAAAASVGGYSATSRVSGKNTEKSKKTWVASRDLLKKRNLLLTLLAYEIGRLEVFNNPLERSDGQYGQNGQSKYASWKSYDIQEITNKAWKEYGRLAWEISSDLAVTLYSVIPKDALRNEIQQLIRSYPLKVRHIPNALQIFTSAKHNDQQCETSHILTWAPTNPVVALSYFASVRLNLASNCYITQFASRILYTTKPEALILYIPQLVQAIRYDNMGLVRRLILGLSQKSNLLAHQLIWNMRTNIFKTEALIDNDMKQKLSPIIERIKNNFTEDAGKFYQCVFDFCDKLTNVSDSIKEYPKGIRRKEACIKQLNAIGTNVAPGVYLPSNPEAIVVALMPETGAPMQSAAKAPYRATFRVQSVGIEQVERCADPGYEFMDDASNQYSQMVIFKVGDDVRQDMLALQLMRLFHNIFQQEGLELYLYTYRVIATNPGCGVIECVPQSRSREDIGRNTEVGLYDYFLHIYGKDDSLKFQKARRNFVMSMAAYSVALFILQIKDRHNGNIMIDDDGHIIHIDFGFLFESSPGGNMRFEPDIKLTAEMILIMGDLTAPAFLWFKELCIRGYLALRRYRQQFLTLVALMLDTELPCFRGHTLEQLNARFRPDSTEAEAARYMHDIINNCAHSLRTRLYDFIQYQQNSIPY